MSRCLNYSAKSLEFLPEINGKLCQQTKPLVAEGGADDEIIKVITSLKDSLFT